MCFSQDQLVGRPIPLEHIWRHGGEERGSPTKHERGLRVNRYPLPVNVYGWAAAFVPTHVTQSSTQKLSAARANAIENWLLSEPLSRQIPSDATDNLAFLRPRFLGSLPLVALSLPETLTQIQKQIREDVACRQLFRSAVLIGPCASYNL